MKVFISWSGERSHQLALVLREWLPSVLQGAHPYVSSEDIRKGARWSEVLGKELQDTGFGILCIVPGNADAPWLNFEAGAVSKVVEHSRVVPMLFGVERSELTNHPLAQFQSALFTESEVLATLRSINDLLGSAALPAERLDSVFRVWWPKLAQAVAAVRQSTESNAARPVGTPDALEDAEKQILALWADRPADLKLQVGHVAGSLQVSEQRARFYLDRLVKRDYLYDLQAIGAPTQYKIDDKGREFLVTAGLA